METVTVSAKVRKDLWIKLKKYKVNISKVIRRALEEEVKKREEEELRRELVKASNILKRIPTERIVGHIREMREAR
ncbi:MAG: hypothetical protein DRJ44_04860 [Thermoprotei archaeon]|nr:MAG: hypothetical protein DRJ44_04860 [Thermoprotei archaeon]